MWHLHGIYLSCYMVADEQEFGIRVVHDVMNLVGHELMQNRYGMR